MLLGMANHPDHPTIKATAKKLGITAQYLASILALRIRPGVPLALRICEAIPSVKPYQLRPDIFQAPKTRKEP